MRIDATEMTNSSITQTETINNVSESAEILCNDRQSEPPIEHQRWMAQWKAAGEALQKQKDAELAAMTVEEAQIATENLLSFPCRRIDRESPRWLFSGLVEQQKYFMKASLLK